MKVSFDGLRMSLSQSYNSLIEHLRYQGNFDYLTFQQKQILDEMMGFIGALNCLYDDNEKDDINDISDRINLQEIFNDD